MEECVCSCYLQVCFCVTNSQGQGLLSETVCVSHSAEPGHETRSLCVCARSVVSDSVQPHGLRPAVLPCPWDFPGKNTEVGFHCLLQGIVLTQGSNLCLLHWQVGFYHRATWEGPLQQAASAFLASLFVSLVCSFTPLLRSAAAVKALEGQIHLLSGVGDGAWLRPHVRCCRVCVHLLSPSSLTDADWSSSRYAAWLQILHHVCVPSFIHLSNIYYNTFYKYRCTAKDDHIMKGPQFLWILQVSFHVTVTLKLREATAYSVGRSVC